MRSKFERLLSLLLVFVMVIGMVPVGYAQATEGNATSVALTPVAPEAGKTYVICFKADNGDYYAMTTNFANKSGHGTLLTEQFTGSYKRSIVWRLVEVEGGYMLKDADGACLTLNGTTKNDAFSEIGRDGEVMTLIPNGDGYVIQNPSERYVNALGGVTGNGSWGALGNWDSGTTVYFFEVRLSGKEGWFPGAVDSQAVNKNANEGEFWKAFDGNSATHWHSNYGSVEDKVSADRDIAGEIDFGQEIYIDQFSFTPRQDTASGLVKQASLYVKGADDAQWKLVAQNQGFDADMTTKTFRFEEQKVRYVKFVAELSNDGWVTVSEFDIGNDHVNTEIKNTKSPSLNEEGYTGDTYCTVCKQFVAAGESIDRLTVKNAQPTMSDWNSGVVSLAECEYVLSGTEGAYSLCHGGNYYVKPAANGNGIPQQNASFAGLTLAFKGNGKVSIGVGTDFLHVWNAGSLHEVRTDKNGGNPCWDKCQHNNGAKGHGDQGNGTDEFYLLKANADSTFAGVPGYEIVTSVKAGESYLIAFANKTGEWFVMYPSTDAVSIAKVVDGAATHTHSYTTTGTTATCEEAGVETKSCTCGHVHKEAASAAGHDWNNGEQTTAPGCMTSGVKTYTCTKCNDTYTEPISALGHTNGQPVQENVVNATCTTEGSYEAVVKCTVCGVEVGRTNVTTDALGHAFEDWSVDKAATCTEAGQKIRLCTRENCGVAETEPINKLGHDYKAVVTAPTCIAEGYTTHTCTRCSDSYVDGRVDAEGHSFTKYVSNNDATCTADGTKTAQCDRCDAKETVTDQGSKLGHTFERDGGDTNAIKCGDCSAPNPNYKPVEVAPNVSFGAGEGESVTDKVKNEITQAVQNNKAVNDYKPVENRKDVEELEITFTAATVENNVPTKLVFDVTPKLNNVTVSALNEAITFRLPVPASVTKQFAKVFHGSVQIGTYAITFTDDGNYVEISAKNFSEYSIQFTDETSATTVVEVDTLAELQAALADTSNELPIVITATIVIAEGEDVTIDLMSKEVTGYMHKGVGALIKNEGTLTLKNGTVTSAGDNGGSALVNSGTATVNGVTLNGAPNADGSWPSYTVNNTGELEFNDSKVTSHHGAVASYYEGAVVTLNGTDIDMAGIPGFTSHALYTYDNGSIIVNSGNIANNAADQNASGASVINGAVTVNGGTFNGRVENYYGTPVIKGGTFKYGDTVVNVSKYVPAGYTYDAQTGEVKKEAPKGNNFNGYVETNGLWGEVWGNAVESFVIKAVDANGNEMGSAALNNIGGIIDGDVNVTWHLYFDAASNTDDYWTMQWITAPTADNMPATVELWVDGVKVSGGDVQYNGPDNLNPIVALGEKDGKLLGAYQNISAAVAAGAKTITLVRDTNEQIVLPQGVTLNTNGHKAEGVLAPVAMIGTQGYATLQAALNAAAGMTGDVTVTLVSDVTENVTLTEKTGLYYTIDGNGNEMNGTITISSLSDTNDNRRITIKGINFVTETARDFITSTATNHYPRLTVEGCSFTGTGNGDTVAIRLKSSHSVVIKDCSGSGLHSFLQNTAGWNLTVENVTVTNSKSGLALGTVQGVAVNGCNINVNGYGIRMDAAYNNNAVISDNTVTAFIPVVVRNASVDSNITVSGTNNMTAENNDGLWCAIGSTEYEENGKLPTASTGKVIVKLDDAGLDRKGICGQYAEAKIGDLKYTTLAEAAADAKSGDEIVMLADVTLDADLTLPAGIILNGNGKTINGSIIAGGDLTFKGHTKVTGFSAGYYNRTITIGEGACLELTGTGRVTLGYGNTFNITGTIGDAKTADKSAVKASLIIPGGMSITGGNDAVMNVTNAYVKIGSTSSKNSSANGKFTLNFTNSIAEFTNQLTFSEPTSGNNPTFELNVKDSVLTTAAKLCIAAPKSTVVIDNSVVTLGTYLRNSGAMTLKNGSVLTGSMIQFGENGGNDGTITVDASELIINNTSVGHAMDGKGDGKLNVVNGGKATVNYMKDCAVYLAVDTTLTSKTEGLAVTTDPGYLVIYENGVYKPVKGVAKAGDSYYLTFEDALAAACADSTITYIEILADCEQTVVKNTSDYYDVKQDLTIGAADGKRYTVNLKPTTGDSIAIRVQDGGKLTIAENVTIDRLEIVANGFATNGENMVIDGTLKAKSLKQWTNNGEIVVNGSVWLGYGDGQFDMAYGNGTVTIKGNGDKTTAQFKAGYSGTRGNGNTLNLKDTCFEAGAWFNVNGADGTFNLDDALLKVSGGDAAGTLTVASSGNTFNVTKGSKLEVSALTLGAGNALNVDSTSQVVVTTLSGKGTITIDATNLADGAIPVVGNATGFNGTVVVTGNDALEAELTEQGIMLVGKPIAVIGENNEIISYHSALGDAIGAVAEGGTIKLLKDVVINESTRTENSGWYDGLYYVGDKSFTIDLGDFTVTHDGSVNDYLLNFKNDGSKANVITLKNGTIDAGTKAFCALCTSGTSTQQITINLENINLINNISNGSVAKIRGGAVLNVNAGTVITGKDSYLGIESVASTVNIYDGAEIYMNGTSSYIGCLVGACGNGTVNVYGGYGKGVKGGFIAMTSGGTINVSGGEWIANTDGTVGDNSNLYVLTAQNNSDESGYAGASIINVTGGTFRGGMDAWILHTGRNEVAELNISGGNFNADPTTYVVNGYKAVANTDGTFNVKVCVAMVGDVGYTTLVDAFKAATEGCTIEILRDVTIDYKWDCRDYAANGSHSQFKESVTINGNGHTIEFTGNVNDGNWNTIFRFEEDATVKNLIVDISEATGAQRVISAKKSLSVDGLTIIGNAKYGIIFGEGASAEELAAAEIEVKNSTLTGTRRAISDNEGGKDVKSVTVTGNTLNTNVYVSASESIVFNNNTAKGEVDLRSNSADNVLSVEAKGNNLTEGVKNYIYAKSIDAQDEFATENPPVKVSTKDELDAALAAAKEGDTIVLTADIDYGTTQLAITKAITLDLGGKTLTTRNGYGGMSVKGNPTIKNGTIVHASNTAAIKVWNATAFEDLVIDVQGKGDANKTIGGIVLQSGSTTRVGSIKNVTIKGEALTNGIETYNCGDATQNVIGFMENVNIDAKGTGLLISAPCGTATNCNISGDKNAIELWIKGTYSASLTLDDSKVEGTVSVHDENASNVTNNGTLSLIVGEGTTGVSEETVTLTINHAKEEQVKGEVLESIIETAQAKVNGTYYATVAEAMAAVTDGATVTILAGTYDYALVLKPAWNNVTVIGEGDVTMKGVPSIKGTNYKVENIDFVYGTGSGNLSGTGLIKDCSFTATNASGNTFRYCYGVKNGAITFKGCKLNAPAWAVHFDQAYGTDLTFTDCEIKGRVALAGDLGSLTATGTTFENGYVNIWGTDDAAVFTGCDFVNVPYVYTGSDADNIVKFNGCGDVTNLIYGGVDKANALIYVDDVLKTGVVAIGENRYATLSEAVNAAQAGETIVLLKNVSEEIQIPDGAKLTLNLNGKTLNGCIKPFKGNLTVENGSIVNTNKSVSGIEITAGELVLNNVNITSARHAVRVEGAATVTIDGGVYKVDPTAKGTYHAVNVGGAGGEKVTIRGGTFIGPKGTMADSGAAVNIRANAEVTIEGGNFSGGKLNTLSNAGTLTVKGGTFDQNPVVYIPEGYVSEKQEDGSYKVRELKHLIIKVGSVTTRTILEVHTVATMDEAVAYAQANPADSVTYQISGPVELTTGGTHGIVNLGKNVTIEGVTPDAKLTIVGDGVPNIKGVTFKNITLADQGTYNSHVNEFMYQNYIDCSFENVTFVDGIRLSGKSTLTKCTVEANTTNEYAIWLDKGEFTMTGSTVTGGNDAYGLIKSDEVGKITIKNNVFQYLGNANKEALNVKGASIKAENNTFIDCTKGILPADKTNYAEDGTTILNDDAIVGDNNKVITNVAQIGEQKFETLEAAYAAAQNGNEVKILRAGTYKVPSGKNITITGMVDGIVFDNIGAHSMGGASVTFNNVTFTYADNSTYKGLQHCGDMVYNNCTFNGQVFLYGNSEIFNDCTFNQTTGNYNVWTYGAKKVEFNNCTFNSAGKSVLVYTEDANHFIDLDVVGSTFNASAAVDGKAAIEIDTSLTAGATITIDAATTATGFGNGNVSGNSLWNNKKGNNTDANNDVTVKVGDQTVLAPVTFVAKIGEIGYTELPAALKALKSGDELILHKDITITEKWDARYTGDKITVPVTINGNGHTIKFTNTIDDSNNFAAFRFEADATVKNLTMDMSEAVGPNNRFRAISAKANLTVDNCHFIGNASVSNTRAIIFGEGAGANIGNVTVSVTDSTFKDWRRGLTDNENGQNAKAVTATGNTFTNAGVNISASEKIVFTNNAVDAAEVIITSYNDYIDSVTVSGNALTNDATGKVEKAASYDNIQDEFKIVATASVVSGETVKYFNTLQAAIDAAQDGDVVNLLAEKCDENVTVVQSPDKVITIDGNGKTMTGSITVDGKSAAYPTAGLTIKNVNFLQDTAEQVFINLGVKGDTNTRYTSNVTVKDCTFTGTDKTACGIKSYTGGSKNLTVTGCTATGMHSMLQSAGIAGVKISDVKIDNSKNGLSFTYASVGVEIVNANISTDGYGIRADGTGAYDLTVKNSTVDAELPVVIRKNTASGYELTLENNTLSVNDKGYQVIFTTGDDEEAPVAPEVGVKLNVSGAEKIFPAYTAKIGDLSYASLADAVAAANAGDEIVMLAPAVVAAGETLELNKAVTITYTSNVPGEDMITNRGNLVIDGATLVYTNTDTTASNVTVSTISCEPGSNLEVKSGIVKNDSANNGSLGIYAYAIDLLTNGGLGDVTATISGGEIICTNYMAIRQFNNGDACKNTLNVTGGKIYGEKRAIQIHLDNDAAYTTISGGEIKAGEGGYALCFFPANATNIAVTGGTFTGTVYSGSNGFISGGSFDERFDDAYCAEGYVTVKNSDGTFGVKIGEYTVQNTDTGFGYETLADALAAVQNGDNTIVLLKDNSENVTIEQVEGVNIVIDGQNHLYTGTITIDGNSRFNGAETLTIQNVEFVTSKADHYFINADSSAPAVRYAHNVTVKDSTFTATGAGRNTAVAMQIRQGFDISIENVTASNMHSLVQGKGCDGLIVDDVTVSGKNGIAVGTSKNVEIKNADIIAAGYGIRADGTVASDMTVENATIKAELPIVVRKNTADGYQLTMEGTNNLSGNANGYQVIFTAVDDEEAPVAPTVNTVLDGIDNLNVFPAYQAKIGNVYYPTLAAAIAAAEATDVVTVLGDIELAAPVTVASGKTVTIDLNGKTISGTDNTEKNFGLFQNNGTLTINDSVGTGKIVVNATINSGWSRYSAVISNNPGGTLVVNGGTIEHLGGTDMAYGIDSLTNDGIGDVSVTINGGHIKSTYRGIRQFLNSDSKQNELIVNGGTIEGANKSIFFHDPSTKANNGKLIVAEAAELKGDVYLFVTAGSTEWPVTVSIADAAFEGESTVMTGNVPDTYLVENTNGTWGIRRGLKGSGTEADPFQISNLTELIFFRDSVNAGETTYNAPGVYVALTADIDMASTDWSVNIGDDCNTTFDGIFDGQNHTIKNLTSTETAAKADGYICTGLFGAIYGSAVIKNLTIDNADINTGDFSGNNGAIVVGFAYTATGSIENVNVTNSALNAKNVDGTGAIVGYVYGGELKITDCSVTNTNITGRAYVGGIVGYADDKMVITNSAVEDAAIDATSCTAGGIAGILLAGGKIDTATVKNVTLSSAHANWQNAAGIAVGTITAPAVTVSNVSCENVNVTAMVGAVHANKPTTPVAKVAARIGDVYYATFDAAYAAAVDGDTVTMLDNVTMNLTIEKAINLDTNGNTFTGEIVLANADATVIGPETMTVTTNIADHKVIYDGTKHMIDAKVYVAQIFNGASYESLDAAIKAASAGDTIVLLADITEDVTVSKAVTIDGTGKTYTGKMTIANGKTVTVQNVIFVKGCIDKAKGTSGTLTVKNCDFDGVDKSINYAITMRGGDTVTVEGVTVKNYGYGFLYVPSYVTNVNVKGANVDSVNYGVHVAYGSKVNVEDVTMTNVAYGIMTQNYGAKTITLTNSSISGTNPIYIWERNTTYVDTYKFVGANTLVGADTWTQSAQASFVLIGADSTLTAPAGLTVTTNLGENYKVVYEDGMYKVVAKVYVAEVNGVKYEKLSEAIAAASAGDTVTLLADITEDVTVSKAVTIDGTGKTYTGKMNLKADTIIKNVNFDGKGYNGYAVETRGAQYLTIEDCTAKNYGYGFVQLVSGTALTTVKNVTVSDMNYGVKVNYSSAVVLENVDITAGVAAVQNSNFGTKTITIKDSKLNILSTWRRNDTTQTTYVFEGANSVDQFDIESALDNFVLGAADATLTAPAGLTVTTNVADHEVVYENGVYALKELPNVAQIGDKTYKSIKAAIDAAQDGDTITVTADHKIGAEVLNEKNFNYETLLIVDGKSVTIDFAGHTVTVEYGDASLYPDGYPSCLEAVAFVYENAGLTLIDSSEGAKGGFMVPADENISIYSMFYNCGGDLTILSGNYNLVKGHKSASLIYAEDDHKTTVADGVFTVGNAGEDAASTKPWIFNTEGKNETFITVTGGTFNQDILMNYGTAKDCEVIIPYNKSVKDNGNGTWSVVDAVCYNANTDRGYTTLTEAVAAAENGETIVLLADNAENVEIAKSIVLNVNGKNYTGIVTLTDLNATLTAVEGLNVITNVPGYNVACENGIYKLVEKVYVAEVNGEKYESIQEAVEAVEAGATATITVIADHELVWDGETKIDGQYAAMAVDAGKTIILDLNGKKLTADTDKMGGTTLFAVFAADEGGNLTVTGNGTVEVTGAAAAYCLMMAFEPGTKLTVENGTYYLKNASDSLIYSGGDECVVVNGGNFTLGNVGDGKNGKPWIFNVLEQNAGAVIVNGGTFNADVNHQFWANEVYVPETLAVKPNGDGTWTVVPAAAYIMETATSAGGRERKVGYATLAEAIAAVKTGETVTLLADNAENIELTKSITLDLNRMYMTGEITLASADAQLTSAKDLNVVTTIADAEVVYENGTYMVKYFQYVAQIGETKYDDLSDALEIAQSGETVKVIANTSEELVLVPAGVTLDLSGCVVTAGNVLSFGIVMDGATDVGGIKISNDTTKAFVKLQKENDQYLPIYDDDAGMYRLFKYKQFANKAREKDGVTQILTLLQFDNRVAYELLTNEANASSIRTGLTLYWNDLGTGYDVRYLFTTKTITEVMQNNVTTGKETYAMRCNVIGLESGKELNISAWLECDAGVMIEIPMSIYTKP